jgi:transposase InsO family protein
MEKGPAVKSAESEPEQVKEGLDQAQPAGEELEPEEDQSTVATAARATGDPVEKAPLTIWHARLGHLGWQQLERAFRSELLGGVEATGKAPAPGNCEICIEGKLSQAPFHRVGGAQADEPLALIHMDLVGPVDTASIRSKSKYMLTLLDEVSRYCWVYFLRTKDQAADSLQNYTVWAERQYQLPVKCYRSDRGGEFTSLALSDWLTEKGIGRQFSVAYTPQQNGAAERLNRTLLDRARTMLLGAGLTTGFWEDAVRNAAWVTNRVPSAATPGAITPYQALNKRVPNMRMARVFGTMAQVWINPGRESRPKFGPRTQWGVFIGQNTQSKAWEFYIPETREHGLLARTAVFHEDLTYHQWMARRGVNYTPAPLEVEEEEQTTLIIPPSGYQGTGLPQWEGGAAAADVGAGAGAPEADAGAGAGAPAADAEAGAGVSGADAGAGAEGSETAEEVAAKAEATDEGGGEEGEEEVEYPSALTPADQVYHRRQAPAPRRSTRATHGVPPLMLSPTFGKSHNYISATRGKGLAVQKRLGIEEPASLNQAKTSPYKAEWLEAVDVEFNRLVEMGTWELVEAPPGAHILTSKWVFALKTHPDGTIERFKARLTIRGFAQKQGVDYEETYANTAAKTTVRAFFAMVCQEDLHTMLLDVSTAFLYGDVDKEIFMRQPQDKEDGTNRVCRLRKSLYGLKQAPRIWQEELRDKLESMGFVPTSIDPSLYRMDYPTGEVVWLLDWVDDMVVAGKDPASLTWTHKTLEKHFKISNMGPVQRYIGMWVDRDQAKGELLLHQGPYILDVVAKFQKELPTRGITIPLPTNFTLPTQEEQGGGSTEGDEPLSPEDTSRLQQLVGILNYVANATRLDVAYATNQLSRCQQHPRQRHLKAAYQVVAYLRDTANLGLRYQKGPSLMLEAFSDASLTSSDPTLKSMTGAVLLVGGAAIGWISRRQDRVTTSTCDSEALAVMTTVQHVEHARDLLEALDQRQKWSTNLYCDNTATVALCHDPVAHKKSVQLTRPMAYVREKTRFGVIHPLHVRTADQAADFLTKTLPTPSFQRCRERVGLAPAKGAEAT